MNNSNSELVFATPITPLKVVNPDSPSSASSAGPLKQNSPTSNNYICPESPTPPTEEAPYGNPPSAPPTSASNGEGDDWIDEDEPLPTIASIELTNEQTELIKIFFRYFPARYETVHAAYDLLKYIWDCHEQPDEEPTKKGDLSYLLKAIYSLATRNVHNRSLTEKSEALEVKLSNAETAKEELIEENADLHKQRRLLLIRNKTLRIARTHASKNAARLAGQLYRLQKQHDQHVQDSQQENKNFTDLANDLKLQISGFYRQNKALVNEVTELSEAYHEKDDALSESVRDNARSQDNLEDSIRQCKASQEKVKQLDKIAVQWKDDYAQMEDWAEWLRASLATVREENEKFFDENARLRKRKDFLESCLIDGKEKQNLIDLLTTSLAESRGKNADLFDFSGRLFNHASKGEDENRQLRAELKQARSDVLSLERAMQRERKLHCEAESEAVYSAAIVVLVIMAVGCYCFA